jgi:hypothetical protein
VNVKAELVGNEEEHLIEELGYIITRLHHDIHSRSNSETPVIHNIVVSVKTISGNTQSVVYTFISKTFGMGLII